MRRVLAGSRDLPDAIRGIYALFASRRKKPRYADKTPTYATQLTLLSSFFPEARFVHTIRDGRNVALSLVEQSFGPKRVDDAVLYWRHEVQAARTAGALLGPERYLEYRHEDLVRDPQEVVARICAFLDLEFVPSMLRYHERRRPGSGRGHLAKPPTESLRDFRAQLTGTDLRVVEALAGDLLVELGYEPSRESDSSSRDASVALRIAGARLRHDIYLRARHLRRSRPVRAARRGITVARPADGRQRTEK